MIEVTQLVQEIIITTVDDTTVLVTTQDPSPGQTGILFEDEGISLGTRGTVNEINFTGAGVAVTRSTDKLTVSVSSGGGSGTVTSVGAPAFHTVANANTTPTFALQTQVKNLVLAGPASGADANPTYRSLVPADLPVGFIYNLSVIAQTAATTLTNQPNSEEYLLAGSPRPVMKFDATPFNFVRLMFNVIVGSASANTPRAYIKYKTTFASGDAVGTFTTIGSGTGTEIISLTSIAILTTSWIAMPVGAQADVFWCVATNGGDAVADPQTGNVIIQFKV